MSARNTNHSAAQSGNNIGEVADDVVSEGAFSVPDFLRGEPIFVTYFNTDERRVPCSGRSAKPRYINIHEPDERHLVTFEEALATVKESRESFPRDEASNGTMLSLGAKPSLNLCCIDIDDVIADDGTMDELASDILSDLDSTYAELSPSGNGAHLYFRDEFGVDEKYHIKDQIECYDNRGVTLSGRRIKSCGDDLAEMPNMLATYQHMYNSERDSDTSRAGNDDEDDVNYTYEGSLSEKCQKLTDAMCEHDETAEEMYNRGNSMSLAQFSGDRSRADMSLISRICWWADEAGMLENTDYTDSDIAEIFLSSDLAQRTKCQTRPDYVRMTIRNAR